MKMCYVGALEMPQSYAVMNEEEMQYLEGGRSFGQIDVNVSHLTKAGAYLAADQYANKPLETAEGKSYGLTRLAKEIRAHAMLFFATAGPTVTALMVEKITGFSISAINDSLVYIVTHSNPIELGGDSDARVAIYNAMWTI